MSQTNNLTLQKIKLPHGVQIEDIKEIRFKLRNRWADEGVVGKEYEVKYKSKTKPGLNVQTPGKILYRAQSQGKFRQHCQNKKDSQNIREKGFVYKLSEHQVYVQEIKQKPTPVPIVQSKQVENPKQPITPKPQEIKGTNQRNDKRVGIEISKNLSQTPNQVTNPSRILETFNPSAYIDNKIHINEPTFPNRHERNPSQMSNLEIISHVSQDLEMLTRKVQDMRKSLEFGKGINSNEVKKVIRIDDEFNSSKYQTPIKAILEKESRISRTNTTKPRLSLGDLSKLNENDMNPSQNYSAPVWSETSPYLSKLMATTNAESQYINVSKQLDFSKNFQSIVNPETSFQRSTVSQKSDKRKPGHFSKSNVGKNSVIDYGRQAGYARRQLMLGLGLI